MVANFRFSAVFYSLFAVWLFCAEQVREGDVVTVRGKGRVEIEDIRITKKGRYKINMCRTT